MNNGERVRRVVRTEERYMMCGETGGVGRDGESLGVCDWGQEHGK